MQMFYVTRYHRNNTRPTLYYLGGGAWVAAGVDNTDGDRSMRLYSSELAVKKITESLTESAYHPVEVEF